MRLSRGRVLLRVVLLAVGGAFMLVRAGVALRTARAAGEGGLLGARLALVWGLVGVLALATATSAGWSLARRPRRRTLRLDGVPRPGSPPAATGGPREGQDRPTGRAQ